MESFGSVSHLIGLDLMSGERFDFVIAVQSEFGVQRAEHGLTAAIVLC